MTRKCFVKMMMSYGYSRNEAVFLAACTNAKGITYSDEYKRELPFLRLKKSINTITAAFNQIVNSAEQFGRAIHESFEKGFSI